eukprot:TRINITY_DN9889_c0_g1_i1.p2 TRINITY_DN9889_c0_g1~~TRINITY_DN9889_c0_g1_i1.p2  ORF type:complete len:114 (+),score=25.78 TRINITY_DN9889_c0_g1_i1:145-486(+)
MRTRDWSDFRMMAISFGTLKQFKLAFSAADRDRTGNIEIPEDLLKLAVALRLDRVVTAHALREAIAQVEANTPGKLDFWECFGLHLYFNRNLQDRVDLAAFVKFLNQTYQPLP